MIEQESEMGNRKLIQEAQKINSAEIKNSEGKKSKLQQEVIQIKQQLQAQVTAHRDAELTLRKVTLAFIDGFIYYFLLRIASSILLKYY